MNYNVNQNLQKLAIAALLCAIGIIVPSFSPVKLVLEPASFTLASHVAIFIAMFISPMTAVLVAIGTGIGFFLSFPVVIAFRAFSHIVFAFTGAFLLKRYPGIMRSAGKVALFAAGIGILHAVCEVLVVMPFFFGNAMTTGYYAKGFVHSVALLVGGGTVVHSLVDFAIAWVIWQPLKKSMQR